MDEDFGTMIDPSELIVVNRPNGEEAVVGYGCYGQCVVRRWKEQFVVEKKLRLISREVDAEANREARIMREAEALKAVYGHPGFPEFYGLVDRTPRDAIVMEYVGDTKNFITYTLSDVECDNGPRLRKVEVVKLLVDVTGALLAQQTRGYLHCDIHTRNVVIHQIDGEWRAKIVDLGLSEVIISSDEDSSPDNNFSARKYASNYSKYPQIAPELLKNKSGDTFASETFAVGRMIRDLGNTFGIHHLHDLARTCQARHPKNRPRMSDILLQLKTIADDLEKQEEGLKRWRSSRRSKTKAVSGSNRSGGYLSELSSSSSDESFSVNAEVTTTSPNKRQRPKAAKGHRKPPMPISIPESRHISPTTSATTPSTPASGVGKVSPKHKLILEQDAFLETNRGANGSSSNSPIIEELSRSSDSVLIFKLSLSNGVSNGVPGPSPGGYNRGIITQIAENTYTTSSLSQYLQHSDAELSQVKLDSASKFVLRPSSYTIDTQPEYALWDVSRGSSYTSPSFRDLEAEFYKLKYRYLLSQRASIEGVIIQGQYTSSLFSSTTESTQYNFSGGTPEYSPPSSSPVGVPLGQFKFAGISTTSTESEGPEVPDIAKELHDRPRPGGFRKWLGPRRCCFKTTSESDVPFSEDDTPVNRNFIGPNSMDKRPRLHRIGKWFGLCNPCTKTSPEPEETTSDNKTNIAATATDPTDPRINRRVPDIHTVVAIGSDESGRSPSNKSSSVDLEATFKNTENMHQLSKSGGSVEGFIIQGASSYASSLFTSSSGSPRYNFSGGTPEYSPLSSPPMRVILSETQFAATVSAASRESEEPEEFELYEELPELLSDDDITESATDYESAFSEDNINWDINIDAIDTNNTEDKPRPRRFRKWLGLCNPFIKTSIEPVESTLDNETNMTETATKTTEKTTRPNRTRQWLSQCFMFPIP